MASHTHRRQVPLFLLAIVLPCAVLVALGVRMIGQERELAEKRLSDERRRVATQIRQDLSSRLERITLQEAAALVAEPDRDLLREYDDPSVALVARVVDGAIVLPWESDRRPQLSRQLLSEADFADRIAQGERAELVQGDPERAAHFFQQAVEVAHHPAQEAYASLLLARALERTGRRDEAVTNYRAVLTSSADLVDEHGIPFSLYAAVRLLQAGSDHRAVLTCLENQVGLPQWFSPPTLHLMRRLARSLSESAPDSLPHDAVRDLDLAIAGYVDRSEQALALRRDFTSLRLASSVLPPQEGNGTTWIAYGAPTWLISLTPPLGTRPAFVVAVHADRVFTSLSEMAAASGEISGEVELVTDRAPGAELLGPEFPGLAVTFSPGQSTTYDAQRDARRRFYLVTLVLVVSATLFSAYLLWRDVQRELRLAEMRSNFVSAVSHELKTPLAAIRMFAESLRMGRPSEPEGKNEYLDTIVNESERLTRLLSNVLDFSKIEQGKKTYRREPHCLAEIVQSTVRAMRYPAEQHGFRLRVHLEDGIPPVPVDRDAIEQAILNLIANAMKYSGESRDIDVLLKRTDGVAVIDVADRGVGIQLDEQQRIFDRFYRVPTPENQRVPGTGLGLTLVRHIVEAHDGDVTVHSIVGQGSTFSIRLPLKQEEA